MSAVETNPVLKLVGDQFGNQPDEAFGESVSPQMFAAIALADAMLGGVKVRKPTPEDQLDEAIALANRLELLCGTLYRRLPAEHESALDECRGMASDILVNIAMVRARLSNPLPVCQCGKCDACVVARSDEHHDRKNDGQP